MFETSKAFKFVEEDVYSKGCLPETAIEFEIGISFSDNTKEGIVNQIASYFGVSREDMFLNACDEDGRIDVSILENKSGSQANGRDVELWKKGVISLYSATYTFHVYKVERELVRL